MKLKSAIFAVAILTLVAQANASIVLNESPPGSASVVFEGVANFNNPRTGFNANLEDTIIAKTFGPGITNIIFDNVTYALGDMDFAGGFRWTERINNNSGFAWTKYTITLSETSGLFFGDAVFSPSFVTINGGGAITAVNTILNDDTPAMADTIGTVTGAGTQTLTFTFNTPLPSGSKVDLHAPIFGLSTTSPDDFQLGQGATVLPVPEATSIAIWGLLGLTAAGWRRARNRKSD